MEMKLTKSQKEKFENEVLTHSKYFLQALLGREDFEKDVDYTTEKYMDGSTAVFKIYCKGYGRTYTIGRNGKLQVFND